MERHVGFMGETVGFVAVAARTGADGIAPGIFPSPADGQDVVDCEILFG
jgi:hypothetical protein